MMFSRQRIVAVVMVFLVMSVFLARPTQGAQFIISSWSYPDENGQGIYLVVPYQNSSGSFVTIANPDTGIGTCYWNNVSTYPLNLTDNTALMFKPRVLVNYTMLGLSHPADNITGRNYIRVNLEMFIATERVFYLQNMTYDTLWGLAETGIWWYDYLNIVNVILVAGQIYTVVITLEVFTEPP